MSIIAMALRRATIGALRGSTLAGDAVYDSPVDPSDIAAKAPTPTIFVFSDAERLDGLTTRDLLSGDRAVDLSLLLVLPTNFSATLGGQTVIFQDRRAGAAAAIDIIYRQIERALIDESTAWGALWCQMVMQISEMEAHAYVLPVKVGQNQINLPARAIRIQVTPIDAPAFGQPPQGVWADFVALMAGDTSTAPLAQIIAAAIQGDALPDWRVDALEVGDTVEDAQLIGDAPLGGGPFDDVVTMTEGQANVYTPGAPDEPINTSSGL